MSYLPEGSDGALHIGAETFQYCRDFDGCQLNAVASEALKDRLRPISVKRHCCLSAVLGPGTSTVPVTRYYWARNVWIDDLSPIFGDAVTIPSLKIFILPGSSTSILLGGPILR